MAPVANAQVVGGILDAVIGDGSESSASDADTSSGQADTSSGQEGSTTSTEESTDSSGGSLVGNVVDALEGDSKTESSNASPLEELVNAINETADETGVSEVVGGTVGAVDHTASQLTGTDGPVKQVTKALGNGGRDKKNPSASPATNANYPTLEVLGETFANARSIDASSRGASLTSLRVAPQATLSVEDGVIAQIGRVAAEAIEKAAFPIALMLMVGAFLMVQNRIDRKDPKLALAPVDPERDLLIFT